METTTRPQPPAAASKKTAKAAADTGPAHWQIILNELGENLIKSSLRTVVGLETLCFYSSSTGSLVRYVQLSLI